MFNNSLRLQKDFFILVIYTSIANLAAGSELSLHAYKVPANGLVTFTLTEQWWEEKGVVVGANYKGDSFIKIQYIDGTQQTIVFLGSSDSLQLDIRYMGNSGSSVWKETALLRAGATFTIGNSQAAWALDRFVSVGGNSAGGAFIRGTVQDVSTSAPQYFPPVNQPPPGRPGSGPAPTKIHALIISGRSDPAKVVTSQNVTLTGGVVALGRDPSPLAAPRSQWTASLHIVPDEALLTGAKIPPLTPNIIDVRIVKHEMTGDLSAPSH